MDISPISHASDSPVFIDIEQLSYLPAATLLRLVQKSQEAAKNFKAFQATVRANPNLFRRFEELDVEPAFGLDNEYITLSFTGDGRKLGAVWGALRQSGFTTHGRPKKGDRAFCAFWEKEGEARLLMNFSSSVCRRVKVGTKMVEQDVYETQCGELPELDMQATDVATTGGFENDTPF